MFGQPGFFTPRAPKDWLSPGNLLSYYDTSVLKTTLERLVDFDRINSTEDMRLSVGRSTCELVNFLISTARK